MENGNNTEEAVNKPITHCVTVDAIIVKGNAIVLIKRKHPPFVGMYALPGGYVEAGESCEQAVVREAKEETNLDIKIKRLVGVYSDVDRDPRGHTISVVYLVKASGVLQAGDDAANAELISLEALPGELAFDHMKMIKDSGILG